MRWGIVISLPLSTSIIDATITSLGSAKPNKSCCLIKSEMRNVAPERIFQLVIPFQGKMSPCFTTTLRKEKITECPRLISLLAHHSTVSLNLGMKNLLMVFHACTAFSFLFFFSVQHLCMTSCSSGQQLNMGLQAGGRED